MTHTEEKVLPSPAPLKRNEGAFAEHAHAKGRVMTLLLLALTLFSLLHTEILTAGVREGLLLAVESVIPSVFPFMILSSLLSAYASFGSFSFLARPFEALFHINRSGTDAFLTGVLCGFPLGVRTTAVLYREGRLSRDEAERLIGCANNTGPAFLLGAVGGMRGSLREGILLYAAVLLSAVAVGMLFGIGHKKSPSAEERGKIPFSLTAAIRSAGESTLALTAYLTFFSALVRLLTHLIGDTALLSFLLPFLEVGNAAHFLAFSSPLPARVTLALTGFAVGFSGLSVHMQALYFLAVTDLSVGRYFLMKLTQGALAALLLLAIS